MEWYDLRIKTLTHFIWVKKKFIALDSMVFFEKLLLLLSSYVCFKQFLLLSQPEKFFLYILKANNNKIYTYWWIYFVCVAYFFFFLKYIYIYNFVFSGTWFFIQIELWIVNWGKRRISRIFDCGIVFIMKWNEFVVV